MRKRKELPFLSGMKYSCSVAELSNKIFCNGVNASYLPCLKQYSVAIHDYWALEGGWCDKELNFKFYLILNNLSLNSYTWPPYQTVLF